MPYYVCEARGLARKIFDKSHANWKKGKGLAPNPFPYSFRMVEELSEDDLGLFGDRLNYWSYTAEGNYVLLRNIPETEGWFQKTQAVVGDAPSRMVVLDIDETSISLAPTLDALARWELYKAEHHLSKDFEAILKMSSSAYANFDEPSLNKFSLHAFIQLPEPMKQEELLEYFKGRAVDLSVVTSNQLLWIQKPKFINGTPSVSHARGIAFLEGQPFHPSLLPEGEIKSGKRQNTRSGATNTTSGRGNELRLILEERIPDKKTRRDTWRHWGKLTRAIHKLSEEDLDGKRNSAHYEILLAGREILGEYETAKEFILSSRKLLGADRDERSLLSQIKKAEEYRKELHDLRNGGDLASGFKQDEIFITDKQSAETLTAIEKGKIPEVGVIVANLHCGFGKTSGVIKDLVNRYDSALVLCHRLSALANLSSELGIEYHDKIRKEVEETNSPRDYYLQRLREAKKLAVTDKSLPNLSNEGRVENYYDLIVIDEAEHFLRSYQEARLLEDYGQNWNSPDRSFRDLMALIRKAKCLILADDCASYEMVGWFAELCRQEMKTDKFLMRSSNDWVKGIPIEKVKTKKELLASTWHLLSQGKRIFMPVDVSDNAFKLSRLKDLFLYFTDLKPEQILWFDGNNLEEGVTTEADKTLFKNEPKKFISQALKSDVRLIIANQIVDCGWNYLNTGSKDERFDEVHIITQNHFTTPDKIKSMFRRIRTNLDFVRVFIGSPFNPEDDLTLTPYNLDEGVITDPYRPLQKRITNLQKLRGWNIRETFFEEMKLRGAKVLDERDPEMILEGLDYQADIMGAALNNLNKDWDKKLIQKLLEDEELRKKFRHSDTFSEIGLEEPIDKSNIKKMSGFNSEQCRQILMLWQRSTREELQEFFPKNTGQSEESLWIQQRLLQEISNILQGIFPETKTKTAFQNIVSWMNKPRHSKSFPEGAKPLHFLDHTEAFDRFEEFLKTNRSEVRIDIFFGLSEKEKTPYKILKQLSKVLFLDLKRKPREQGKSTELKNELFKRNKCFGTVKQKKYQLHSKLMKKLNEGKMLSAKEEDYIKFGTEHYIIQKEIFTPAVLVEEFNYSEALQEVDEGILLAI